MKKGGKRVFRKVSVLKKLLAKKMRKIKSLKKSKVVKRRVKRRVKRCGMGFGEGSPFLNPSNFGYNQQVKQTQQTLSQSNSIVNDKLNNL